MNAGEVKEAGGREVEEVDGVEPKAKGAGNALGATDTTGVDKAGVAVIGVILCALATAVVADGALRGSPPNPLNELEGAEDGAMLTVAPNENIAGLFLSSEAGMLDAPNDITAAPVPVPAPEDDGATALAIELLLSPKGLAEGTESPNAFEGGATTEVENPVNTAEAGGTVKGAPNGAAEGVEPNLKLVEVVGTGVLSGIVIPEKGFTAELIDTGALKLKGAAVKTDATALLSGSLTASRTFSQERHLSVPLGFCTKQDMHFTTSVLAATAQRDPATGAVIAAMGTDSDLFAAADGAVNWKGTGVAEVLFEEKKSAMGCAGAEAFREDSQETQLLAVLLFCTKQDGHF